MLSLYNKSENIAITDGECVYSYTNIHSIVYRIMSFLLHNNIKRIAMFVEQGLMNYCLEWASYYSDCTFCCYDVDAPIERIKYCHEVFNPDIVVSNKIIEGINCINFDYILDNSVIDEDFVDDIISQKKIYNNDIAYVLFTSGSTGIPKGVQITRTGLENVVEWARRNYYINCNSIYAQYSKNNFDLSVLDIFLGWSMGAQLIPCLGIDKLLPGKFIKKNKITHWHSVPSAFIAIQNRNELTEETLDSLETIVFCGETLYPNLAEAIITNNPKVSLWNTYGPTEATIFCSAIKITSDNFSQIVKSSVSIGSPISHVSFYIDSEESEGELIICGDNIARGYLNLNEDTHFFTTNKMNTETNAYRSGDIVKLCNNNYFFMCRKDNQVKIAGNRFDLDEITNALHRLGLTNVASILVGNSIFTFIANNNDDSISVEYVMRELKLILPKYGLPAQILFIDEMPLNTNGKIDRSKLERYIV